MAGDFDVAYSTANWTRDEDFDLNYNHTNGVEWSGSFLSKDANSTGIISEGADKLPLNSSVLQKCDSLSRNLYLTITRINETAKPNATQVVRERRMLQGTRPDFYIGLYSDLGGGQPPGPPVPPEPPVPPPQPCDPPADHTVLIVLSSLGGVVLICATIFFIVRRRKTPTDD